MSDSNKWLLFAGVVLLGWLLYLLQPVLTPFLLGALFAYLGDPLADRLETRMPRSLAVSLVFIVLSLLVLSLLLILLPMLERQVSALIQKLPSYLNWIREQALPWLQQRFGLEISGVEFNALLDTVRANWQTAGGLAAQLLTGVSRSGLAAVAVLVNLVLVPVVTFYLLRDWDVLMGRLRELLPRRQEALSMRLIREADEVLGSFLRGQMLVMLALGVIYSLGLSLVGLDLALLIGLLAGAVSFVPYLGFIVGVGVSLLAALMQFHDLSQALWVLAPFAVGQVLESVVLTPYLVGDRIGLHPVAVIFAVMAGGQLFGFMGVLLALPVAAVVMVLLRHAHRRYLDSSLYAEDARPADPA